MLSIIFVHISNQPCIMDDERKIVQVSRNRCIVRAENQRISPDPTAHRHCKSLRLMNELYRQQRNVIGNSSLTRTVSRAHLSHATRVVSTIPA